MKATYILNTQMTQRKMLALTVLLAAFSTTAMAENNTIDINAEQINNLGIQMGKLEAVNQQPLLTAPATVVIPSAHEYIVSASQAGLISRLHSSVGENVKKGALLAQINSPELLALQGRYLKTLSALNLAVVTHERDKKLLKEGVIASRREQETLSLYNAAVLDVNEAQQLLEIAGMTAIDINQLKATHQLNSALRVHAPISGTVIERMAVAGTRVDMLAPLYRIADLSELWLEISIPQERLSDINIGNQVVIENTSLNAKISLLGQSVNPDNQTVIARALIQADHTGIRPGQRVNIQIIQDSDSSLFKIPNTAIAQNEGKSFVFVRTPKGFSVNAIDIVGKQDSQSTVTGDFTGNEDIATQGAVALKANWLGLGGKE
ncbi:efflux RND transporter periplasmic adaptor subunit [Crenothrix polyspora]|uniref:Efflux transporter, RND family, MFP subunit n=1 Tax=Crenothrix polyspora TaxID=360316 RepID=A0A1R4H5C3_9GAMM|nr:efflux RND transporter periplasmic adaptor subunit [Crenothrix polyspora]SJM91366.1 Efflux transporter, RND family, MFP subunit [Crenothrix polyspora]